MVSKANRWVVGISLVAGMLALGGCQNARLTKERDALWVQNKAAQKKIDHLQQALDASENQRQDLQQRVDNLKTQLAAAQKPAPRPEVMANTGFGNIKGVQTTQSPGKITVRVPGDVLFAPGKATLRSSSKHTLRQIADVIKRKYSDDEIRVEGYTDTDPIRKSHWKDNLALSLARAAAVQRYLESLGANKDRMYSAGYGASKPLSTKAKSRRVQIVVVLPH